MVAVDSDPTPPRGVVRPRAVRVHPVDLEPGDRMLNGWRVDWVGDPVMSKDTFLRVHCHLSKDGRTRVLNWRLHEAQAEFVQVYRSESSSPSSPSPSADGAAPIPASCGTPTGMGATTPEDAQ